jgi:hypothetical protein
LYRFAFTRQRPQVRNLHRPPTKLQVRGGVSN